MDKSEIAFSEYFGSRIDHHEIPLLANIIEESRLVVEILRQKYPNYPSAFIDITEHHRFSAEAKKYKGIYLIGISVGAIIILMELFSKMISNKNVLKEIGDVTKELDIEKIDIVHDDATFLARLKRVTSMPRDKVRRDLVSLLLKHSVNSIVLHEYGHIVSGHCDFIANQKQPIDNLLRQTLEYDADCFSTNQSIKNLIIYYKNPKLINSGFADFFSKIEVSIKLWYFSLYSTLRLQSQFEYQNSVDWIDKKRHPLAGIRQFNTAVMIGTILDLDKSIMLKKSYSEISTEVVNEVEQAFDEISFQGFNNRAFKVALTDEAQIRRQQIKKCWNLIRADLQKVAHVRELAPLYILDAQS